MFRVFGQYVPVKSFILVFSEMLMIAGSLYLALWIRLHEATDFRVYVNQPYVLLKVVAVLVVCFVCFYYNDLYDLRAVSRRWELLIRLTQALGATCVLLAILYFVFPDLMLGRGVFVLSVAIFSAALILWRMILDFTGTFFRPEQKVLVAGTGALGIELVKEILEHPELNFNVLGFLGESPDQVGKPLVNPGIIGTIEDVDDIAFSKTADRVILALAERRRQMPLRQLLRLKMSGVKIEEAHALFEKLTGRILLNQLSPSFLILSDGFKKTRFQRFMKRSSDVIIASIGLVLMSPILVVIAALIYLESGRPIFFRQLRTGYKGREFQMLKFRSMRQDSESGGAKWAQQGDSRITRVGKFIRIYRLDEIPQFINVLRGEMSIIGPRPEQPLLVQMLQEKIPFYQERHNVRPGISGWAQIRFKYGASIEDTETKLEYDLFYIKHMSPTFDLAIAFRTVQVMIFGHGAV